MQEPFLVIVGPTAVGKTALSLPIAQALDAEIVNVDSRQIYRYMDIGTAKPSMVQQDKWCIIYWICSCRISQRTLPSF